MSYAILNVSPATGKVAAVMVIWAEELMHRAEKKASNIRLIGWLIIKKKVIGQQQSYKLRNLFACGFKGTPVFRAKNVRIENCMTITKK
jgi:hypothetical protein